MLNEMELLNTMDQKDVKQPILSEYSVRTKRDKIG